MTKPLPFAAPRGLSRAQAAAYIGVSPSKFDQLVSDGRMPQPKRIDARTVWDRLALDLAFENIDPGAEDDPNEWDEVFRGDNQAELRS